MSFRAPVQDIQFILRHVVDYARVQGTARFAEASDETTSAILSEAGKISEEVLAPLQIRGDRTAARLENGVVRTSPGFAEAWRTFADGGWVCVAAPQSYGGMGLPLALQTALNEMTGGACLGFQVAPLLSQGQIEALEQHGEKWVKDLYLPKLISGEWTATMNLTEPHAGSDVGALTTKAEPQADGSYAITGQKVYITYGDHDMAENVSHLVLARLPDAPFGSRGISLFVVPKLLPDEEGRPGVANDLRVVSLEHKLGLHASPTCVMEYSGATGWMVGAPGGGLSAMFTMMNNARLGVGVQAVGVAEAATQHALTYAMDRKQGRAAGRGTIVEHADVRRMLARMRADTFASRALCYDTAVALDLARAAPEPGPWAARAALLTPICKVFGSEVGNQVAHIGIQVHGGMGVIEETGAAQYARDVRVATIYEGTTGIQAMDLVARKMLDGGEAAFAVIDEIEAGAEAARDTGSPLAAPVWEAAESLREATETLISTETEQRFAGAVAYCWAFARVLGGHYHLRAAMAEGASGPRSKLAAFYIHRLLPEHGAYLAEMQAGSDGVLALSPDDLAALAA